MLATIRSCTASQEPELFNDELRTAFRSLR
jgi:hypothetical protein